MLDCSWWKVRILVIFVRTSVFAYSPTFVTTLTSLPSYHSCLPTHLLNQPSGLLTKPYLPACLACLTIHPHTYYPIFFTCLNLLAFVAFHLRDYYEPFSLNNLLPIYPRYIHTYPPVAWYPTYLPACLHVPLGQPHVVAIYLPIVHTSTLFFTSPSTILPFLLSFHTSAIFIPLYLIVRNDWLIWCSSFHSLSLESIVKRAAVEGPFTPADIKLPAEPKVVDGGIQVEYAVVRTAADGKPVSVPSNFVADVTETKAVEIGNKLGGKVLSVKQKPVEVPTSAPQTGKSSGGLIAGIVIAVILIVIIAAIAVWYFR